MKKYFVIIFTLLALIGCAGNSESDKKTDEPVIPKVSPPTISISGISENETTNSSISVLITTINSSETAIKLNGAEYISGTIINNDGEYLLQVSAKNNSGLITKEIKFNIKHSNEIVPKNLTELINNLEKMETEKRGAYFDKYFDKIKAATEFPYIDKNNVTFVYISDTKKIGIQGDAVGGWDKSNTLPLIRISGTPLNYLTLYFQLNTRLEYKFIVDGMYTLDPLNEKVFPNEYKNNEFYMPEYIFKDELKPHPEIPHGTIEDKTITCDTYTDSGSKISTIRNYSVYLPPGYDKTKKYKVIYYQDGGSYKVEGKVPDIIDYMISKNEIEPVIAVFVYYVFRDADYIQKSKDAYLEWLVTKFIPLIESNYPVESTPEGRTIVGESNSGSFALYSVYKHPEVFGNVLSDSGAYNAGNYSNLGTPFIDKVYNANLPVKYYMTAGNYEYWYFYNKLIYNNLLNNDSVKAIKFNRTSLTHNFRLWGDTMRDGLKWILDKNSSTKREVNNGNIKLHLPIAWNISGSSNQSKCYVGIMKSKIDYTKGGLDIPNNFQYNVTEKPFLLQEITPGSTKVADLDFKVDKMAKYQVVLFFDNNNNKGYDTEDTLCGQSKVFVLDEEDKEDVYVLLGTVK